MLLYLQDYCNKPDFAIKCMFNNTTLRRMIYGNILNKYAAGLNYPMEVSTNRYL